MHSLCTPVTRLPQALCFARRSLCPPSDLVGMYAHENVVNLTRYALPLEEFVRQEEERSARLAATLLPQYQANGELMRPVFLSLCALRAASFCCVWGVHGMMVRNINKHGGITLFPRRRRTAVRLLCFASLGV